MPDDTLTIYAQTQPDKPGVIDDRPDGTVVRWTYAELEARSNRVANLLLSLGVGPRTKVLWCGPNSPEVVAVMNATRKIGAVAVPLNYRLTPEEALYVINDSDAEVVYTDHEHVATFAGLRDQLEKVRHIIVVGGGVGGTVPDGMLGEADIAAAPADAPAAAEPGGSMIYTSGTTGKPKGAFRGHPQDPATVGALLNQFGYRPDDVYIVSGPLYHSGPSAFMAAALLYGQTIIVQRRFDAEDWLRLVDTYKASSTFSAPALIRMICALPAEVKERYDRISMRIMIANAAPWSYALKQQYVADFPPESLFEVYGSTELGVDTVLMPEDQMRKPGSCGKPAPGIEIKLDEDGEVLVKSDVVMLGYRNLPEKTAEAFTEDGWLRTGDIGAFDEDGYLSIIDRKKELIISAAGKNMSPANIEATIKSSSPLIGQACCIGDMRPYNTALIVLDADFAPAWAAQQGIEDTTLESLARDERVRAAVQQAVDAANEKLARVEQIKKFEIVAGDWLPGGDELTPTMKLKRKPIAAKYERAIDALYA